MRDLDEDLLLLIVSLAMQDWKGENDSEFLRRAKAWLTITIARRDACYYDERVNSARISDCNRMCQCDFAVDWARVLRVPSIPRDILSCPETLEACQRWFLERATSMCELVLCQYNSGVIYKRDWKAPPLWNARVVMRRDNDALSVGAQANWIWMVARRQAECCLADLLYMKGVLGPRPKNLDRRLPCIVSGIDAWGKYLMTADWWLQHQKDCAMYHAAAIAEANDRVTIAFNSEVSVSEGNFLLGILRPSEPGTQSGTESDTESDTQSLALSLALMSLALRVYHSVFRGQE
tara:strand:+ start:355 stop:1230 length:876 start_codon:yes stop_codon:yes gene_type:complete